VQSRERRQPAAVRNVEGDDPKALHAVMPAWGDRRPGASRAAPE
jgi:hypothetical protein